MGENALNQYGISTTFEKLLAHNVPGIILVFHLLMLIDINTEIKIFAYIITNMDIKAISAILVSILFVGFVFGLIVDEIHHMILEENIYVKKAKKAGKLPEFKDIEGNKCSESYYLPFMGLDLYKYNLKHFYSYSEFDSNISIVLFVSSFIAPSFIRYYTQISDFTFGLYSIIIFGLALLMAYAGYTAFCDYYSAFNNTLKGVLKKQNIDIPVDKPNQ